MVWRNAGPARVAGRRRAGAVFHAGRRRRTGAGTLPDAAARHWRRFADTTLLAPDDVAPAGMAVHGTHYRLGPHGIAIFEDNPPVVE